LNAVVIAILDSPTRAQTCIFVLSARQQRAGINLDWVIFEAGSLCCLACGPRIQLPKGAVIKDSLNAVFHANHGPSHATYSSTISARKIREIHMF
jgi:hypothetical protein